MGPVRRISPNRQRIGDATETSGWGTSGSRSRRIANASAMRHDPRTPATPQTYDVVFCQYVAPGHLNNFPGANISS